MVVQHRLFPSTRKANGHTQVAIAARCPKCSGNLIMQEGCLSCPNCGYSKCE